MGPDVFSHVRHFLAEKAKGSCRGRRDVHSEAAMRFVWTRPAAAGLAQAIGRRTAQKRSVVEVVGIGDNLRVAYPDEPRLCTD